MYVTSAIEKNDKKKERVVLPHEVTMPKIKESQVSEMKLSSVREIPPESIRISTSRTGEEKDAQLARSRAEERYERSPAQIRRPVVIERPKDNQKKKEEEIVSNS
jgi:hypothetical protein